MTLKENFENIIYNYIGSEWDRRDVSNSLENDAEEFAIGFAEWTWNKELITINDCGYFEYKFNLYTRKELLEIYKKENETNSISNRD